MTREILPLHEDFKALLHAPPTILDDDLVKAWLDAAAAVDPSFREMFNAEVRKRESASDKSSPIAQHVRVSASTIISVLRLRNRTHVGVAIYRM